MRLRPRLLIASITLIMLPAMISFAGFYLLSRWAVPAMKESVEQRTRLELDQLVRTAVAPLAAEDDVRLGQLITPLAADPSFAWAMVRDAEGHVRSSEGSPPAVFRRERAVESDGTVVTGWAPIEVEGLVLGHVGIAYRMTRAQQVDRWSSILGLAAVIATCFGIAFSIVFSRRFVTPIERMKRYAAAVTSGDLSHRISSTDPSELGELARHLDTMTVSLQTRNEELVVRRQELERAVAEIRTTQDELMRSSRLAAVGEMAGRTAHEVLNPAQSLHGRLSRMASDDLPTLRHNAEVLAAIVGAWREAYQAGPAALSRALAEPVGEATALDADLAALDELVRWGIEASERSRADLEFLHRELDRITRIVDGMRSMCRQSSSQARLPLASVLAEACEIVRDACVKRNIAVRWSAPSSIVIEVDRYELLQVLTNLLRNAMPAIEQRHGRAGGHIELTALVSGDRVALEVCDDGTGISEHHVPFIFEQSFTTRSASEGTGLGLSISRRLVRQMGGELSLARTAIGQGTTFLIDLPLAPEISAEPPAGLHANANHDDQQAA